MMTHARLLHLYFNIFNSVALLCNVHGTVQYGMQSRPVTQYAVLAMLAMLAVLAVLAVHCSYTGLLCTMVMSSIV